MDDNTFGTWLDDQLRRSGVSRRELAEALQVSLGSINAWIGGYRWISERNADEVADFFGVPRNVVREMADRPTVSGPVPGLVGLRGSPGVTGVASVAFIPVIGATPHEASLTAEMGDVMPFAAEYAARFRQPGIITVADDSLAHRGIRAGEGLLIERDIEPEDIRTGALVVLKEAEDRYTVMAWFSDDRGEITLLPAGESGTPRHFDPDDPGGPELVGMVRSVFSVRNIG